MIGIQRGDPLVKFIRYTKDQIYFDPFLAKEDLDQEELIGERQKKFTSGCGRTYSLLPLQLNKV